ncbi:hypothetical protein FJZ53_05475, partial [Candidatus Woesearchaeota archaeon]|nr:hypothetical protein [Candidatus Woesearchaeota archaeon]
EAEMIKEFIRIVDENNPDYLVGYYSDSFDMPYLKTRAEKNKIEFRIGGEKVVIKKGVVRTKGIIHLDVFDFIKSIMGYSLKTENYDLNSVAKELIGEGKIEIDFLKAVLAWDARSTEMEKFCEYNLNDAEITYKIAKKIMPNISELTKVIGQPAVDIVRMSYGQMVEWYLIRKAHQYGEIVPNKPCPDKIAVRRMGTYKGAFVYEPKPGLYENLAIMDFKGLYPSIIATHNISAITLTDKDGVKTPEIETDSGKKVFYHFKKSEGFITKSIKELIEARNKVKEEIAKNPKDPALNARSYALKTVANASYGYMGFFAARWYSREAAEATTAYGRHYILQTIEEAKKEFEVTYGDSVGKDSEVIIQNLDGETEFKKISELYEKTAQSSSGKEYDFKDGIKALTLNDKGKCVFRPVKYVMRHKTNKKMFRVHLTNNWHIDITEDHSLIGYQTLKFNNTKERKDPLKRIIEIKPDDLKKKASSLIVLKKIPNNKTVTRNYPKEVYEFMGYFIGDGSFLRNKSHQRANKDYYLRLSLGKDSEEVFGKLVQPLIGKEFIKSYWWSKTRKGDITVNGLKLIEIISKDFRNAVGKKQIPDWLLEETEENICAFLRGLFSADGCVMIRNNAPIIKLTSIYDEYITKIRKLLFLTGISHSSFKENSINRYKDLKKGKVFSTGSQSRNIILKNKEDFVKKIGFIIDRKNIPASIKTNPFQKKLIKDYEFDLNNVIKIEKIDYDDYVYDLEVEDTHKFFANNILVHNTDSVCVVMGKKTKEDVLSFIKKINDKLPGLIELEVDDFYPRGIFVAKKSSEKGAKKKYALLDEENEIVVKGFETIRRDWSRLAKDVQRKVLEIILKENSPKKAMTYTQDVIQKIRKKKYETEDMIIKTTLQRPLDTYQQIGPHVAVARRMVQQGMYVSAGSTIMYVITEGEGQIRDRARLPQEAKDYDAEYYVNNQIVPAVEQIFEVLGYKREDLIKEKSQKTLGDF